MPEELPERFNLAAHFLDEPAKRHPNRAAIAGEPDEVTYSELTALANRVGNGLLELGVARGDRVLIVLPDSAEFIAAFFGATKIGAVAVPVNSFARAADFIHYVQSSEPRAGIVHSDALPEFLPASAERAQMPIILVGEETTDAGGVRCSRWSEWTSAASERLDAADTSAHDMAFFLYTSGSGGSPKAAVHQHKDMLATSRSFARGVLRLCADDITFSVSKLFFAYGLGNGMYFPFSVGARTVLNPERTKVERVIEMVARHRPTVFFAVPTFYAALLRQAEGAPKRMDFSSVRQCVSAGETLPEEIFDQWRRRFGLEILDGIGSTEMLHMILSARPGECAARTSARGRGGGCRLHGRAGPDLSGSVGGRARGRGAVARSQGRACGRNSATREGTARVLQGASGGAFRGGTAQDRHGENPAVQATRGLIRFHSLVDRSFLSSEQESGTVHSTGAMEGAPPLALASS